MGAYDQNLADVKQLVDMGDLTSAMIRYRQHMAESQASHQPIYLGRYRRR